MKYLRLLLCLSLVAFTAQSSVVLADDSDSASRLFLTKASDTTAKASIGSKTSIVPISFADGASWDNVKHSYTADSSLAAKIEAGKVGITIGSDGTASFKTVQKKK